VLSEVFEHLPDPQAGLSAALTYARRYVVFSTQELCAGELERRMRLALADADAPHAELNFVMRADFAQLFGSAVALAPQFRRTRRRLLEDVPRAQWREHVAWLTQPRGWRSSEGLLAVISVDGSPIPKLPKVHASDMLDALLAGPPRAEPQQHPPWEWLEAVHEPESLVLNSPKAPAKLLHLMLQGKSRIFEQLHKSQKLESPMLRRRASKLIPWLERIGFLTCNDSLAVKLRWLLER
jgi:hypothetical protein